MAAEPYKMFQIFVFHPQEPAQETLSANLQGSVDASLKHGKHQHLGILLGDQAKSLDGLCTSGSNLLGAVSSADEPCQ